MITVSIANPYEQPLDFAAFKTAARAVLAGEGIRNAKITLAFLNNPHMHRLNKQYLDHDEPTDVLTFPYTKPKAAKLEGEIAIGYEVASANAAERRHELNIELMLYVIHGCLHLCGYDDRDAKSKKQMRSKEREYLRRLKLPDITDP